MNEESPRVSFASAGPSNAKAPHFGAARPEPLKSKGPGQSLLKIHTWALTVHTRISRALNSAVIFVFNKHAHDCRGEIF